MKTMVVLWLGAVHGMHVEMFLLSMRGKSKLGVFSLIFWARNVHNKTGLHSEREREREREREEVSYMPFIYITL